jgi:hypothetical protein
LAAAKLQWKSPGLELNDIGFVGQTDWVGQNIWFGYQVTEPFSIFRKMDFTLTQWNNFNFGGLLQNSGLNAQGNIQFKNLWSIDFGIELNSENLSSTALRGGPRLLLPSSVYNWIWAGSNYTKDINAWAFYLNRRNKDDLHHYQRVETEVEWKISSYLNLSVYADWDREHSELMYVREVDFYGSPRYILSRIHSESVSMQFGLNWNILPTVSVEYRARPYMMSGKYDQFKVVTDGDNTDFEKRFDRFTNNILLNNNIYYCDEDRNVSWDYSFENPNFVYNSIQSNLVFRWEYQPGSTLFLVWSLNNSTDSNGNRIVLPESIQSLQEKIPQNVFLVKVSYRLGR